MSEYGPKNTHNNTEKDTHTTKLNFSWLILKNTEYYLYPITQGGTHVPGTNGKGIYQIDNESVDTSDKASLTTLKKVKEYIDKRCGTEKAAAPTNKRNSNDICSLINKIDEVVKDGRECHIKIEIDIK